MAFKPPLDLATIHAIQSRYVTREGLTVAQDVDQVRADILALLWEVKRHRAMLLRLHQLRANLPRPPLTLGDIWAELMHDLDNEPCVKERDEWARSLFIK